MKCYNHHDRDAFAVCKSCGKGLCLECLQKSAGFIHCKDSFLCKLRTRLSCCFKFTLLILIVFIVVYLISMIPMPLQ